MVLSKFRCVHFKNHAATELTFSDQLNVIVGPNGAGKTTVLDGIHYLSFTRSAFNAVDIQHIQHGEDAFVVEGNFIQEAKSSVVRCYFHRTKGKHFQNNQSSYPRLRDHIGLFPIVLTTPYDIDLIRGGNETRRKFFDTLLCQLDETYLTDLWQYQRLLKQRNSLLRLAKISGQLSQDLLATYDHQLIPLNHRLFARRYAFIERFLPCLQKHYQYFSSASEVIDMVYDSVVSSSHFEQLFRDSLQQDLLLQRTTQGIHRDEICFHLNGYPVKKFGSQGQQKSFIIALRLAQFECMHKALQRKPLLLLDDIFASLDEQRIDRVMRLMIERYFGQVFITDANAGWHTAIMQKLSVNPLLIRLERGRYVA